MRAQSSTAWHEQFRRWWTLSTAILFMLALLVASHARAWPLAIPVGSSAADELVLNFDTSALEVPASGRFTFFLMTSNLNAGDSIEIKLYGGLDGKDSMGVIYSGPFVSYEGNCAIGDALCSVLLDGSFSIGLRATSGNVQLIGGFIFATGSDNVPTSPVVATVGTAVPQPASVPPAPPALPTTTTTPTTATPPATSPPPTARPATAATVDLIEYHHAAWNEYFITAIPEEIAALDNGTFAGWMRTGREFKAYPPGSSQGVSVCRFFSTAFTPSSSHFYTPFPTECAGVKANPDWSFEGEVFRIDVPDFNGTCPSSSVPVYRLYNNGQGGAPSHRYTVDLAVRAQMVGQGWISEGYGPFGVIMCAPQ